MKKNIFLSILSGLLTVFVWHNFLVSGNSVIFIFVFISSYITMQKIFQHADKRKIIITSIVSIIFAVIEVVCNSINMDYTLNHILNKWLVINFLGYYIISMTVMNVTFFIFENFSKSKINNSVIKIKNQKINSIWSNSKVQFILCVTLITVAWIPYFLKYYPGIVTPDSYTQIGMAIGNRELSNHHPITHTGIVAIFVNIGLRIFKNINLGIALYSIVSMLIMAILGSCVLQYLRKKGISKVVRILILLYYMLYPINAIYSITMWKDIFFSGMIPILILFCRELIFNTEEFFNKKRNIIAYVIVSLLTILLKHNGLYAILLTFPFILIVLKKYWKKTVPLFLSIIVLYSLTNTLIYDILKIKKGSVAEMLSIPTQQIARVEKYHREELDDFTKQTINKFFTVENIGDNYNPILSDDVKGKLDTEYFNDNKMEFIKLWGKLLIKYPKDYVESFISNSYGYYYVEAKYWVVSRVTMDDPNNPMGIEQQSKISNKVLDYIDSTIDNRDIPLVSMCFSVGACFWLIVVCLVYKIYTKEYKNILIYLPILILWLTMIASPVFCEYRYAYPMFTTLPLYIVLNFKEKGEIE